LVLGSIIILKTKTAKLIKMITDPIADYLTRVRNAIMAGHRVVEIPASKIKKEITKILFDQGYILSYKFEDNIVQGTIKIALKYDKATKASVIKKLQRISTPGVRKYVGADEMPRVLNGLGIAIISTSKGVMTTKKAQLEHVGGEVLCFVY
jgi:small subunit ribosomal protein S8